MEVKKQIEKAWWTCAIGTVIFSVLGQMHLDPSRWTIGIFALSFFGFLLSSLAWAFASHLEYVKNLERKVEELEKERRSE